MALRQIMVQPPASTERKLGKCNISEYSALFPASPVYSGRMTDESVTNFYYGVVLAESVSDNGHTFGTVNIDYQDSPNLETVVCGGGGLPGTPWSPNPAGPTEGQNYATIPEVDRELIMKLKGGDRAFVGNSLTSPHTTAAKISKQRVGKLRLGSSEPLP